MQMMLILIVFVANVVIRYSSVKVIYNGLQLCPVGQFETQNYQLKIK